MCGVGMVTNACSAWNRV